ncbi:CDP-glucose 4,6-dehydratase [Eubacterium plexicaudatum ASF492]|uniref:CDP-glucose 4,6-dehydratase n=1 Tax=Eubacterium plexicaudatum ASF492 TaxID=1235802 RepID=N2AAH0_9FIRM|nr:CDP-glucose 4,6-dehydratase [Eubacterium plexicaudatum ASF492]
MWDMSFYKNKKILITGHTGFKGAWMCQLLLMAGADVTGYALEAPTQPALFDLCQLSDQMHSVIGDIRDLAHLKEVFAACQPEIVIHMAAQPLVRESYKNPVHTYETNVMGTVNVLECVRTTASVKSFLNVTTDKVYLNKEWEWGYRENEELNGFDPYSNSKSCSELVTCSYKNSFFTGTDVAISTARAGNVIGGGDFAADRIIPDCIRAAQAGQDIIVRNPYSTRPYEHVLEPVVAYLMIAQAQYEDQKYAGNYNVGPNDSDCLITGELVSLFCRKWNEKTGSSIRWIDRYDGGPHEASFLKLDCSRLRRTFGWTPTWNVETTIEKIVEWFDVYFQNGDISTCMKQQILDFCK